jgi:hypothetical protein
MDNVQNCDSYNTNLASYSQKLMAQALDYSWAPYIFERAHEYVTR